MESREYVEGYAPVSANARGHAQAGRSAWRLDIWSWTPRTTIIAWGIIHAIFFLGIFKAPFRLAAMTYYATGSDTQHVYWPAVQKILAGHIPYVDPHFFVEYPPLATAFFVVPALLHPATLRVYDWLFAVEILAVDLATLPLIAALARRQRVSVTGALTAYGVVVPALGSLVVQRYDLVPAALTLGALLALLTRRSGVAWTLLLLATLMKIYPAALAPLFLIYEINYEINERRSFVPRDRDRARGQHAPDWRAVMRQGYGVILYAGGLIGSTVVWYLLAPASLVRFIHWEMGRGIEIESLFGSLTTLGGLAGLKVTLVHAYGSFNVASEWAAALEHLSTVLTVCLLAAVYISYTRRRAAVKEDVGREARALVTYATLAVLAVLLGSKLLSIQFLLWLVPLLVVQAYHLRRVAALTFVIFAMSQWIYPMNWNPLLSFEALPIFVLAARDLLLVILFVTLWRCRHAPLSRSMEVRR